MCNNIWNYRCIIIDSVLSIVNWAISVYMAILKICWNIDENNRRQHKLTALLVSVILFVSVSFFHYIYANFLIDNPLSSKTLVVDNRKTIIWKNTCLLYRLRLEIGEWMRWQNEEDMTWRLRKCHIYCEWTIPEIWMTEVSSRSKTTTN